MVQKIFQIVFLDLVENIEILLVYLICQQKIEVLVIIVLDIRQKQIRHSIPVKLGIIVLQEVYIQKDVLQELIKIKKDNHYENHDQQENIDNIHLLMNYLEKQVIIDLEMMLEFLDREENTIVLLENLYCLIVLIEMQEMHEIFKECLVNRQNVLLDIFDNQLQFLEHLLGKIVIKNIIVLKDPQ